MQNLNICIIQSDITWNEPAENLAHYNKLIADCPPETDILVLPEMFTTGFNMQPTTVFETMDSDALSWMQKTAAQRQSAVCGSLLLKQNDKFYNRLFWVNPDGTYDTYDKKHLFSFVGEQKVYTAGQTHKIINFKGLKILLIICYDLRFPVWCRNKYAAGGYAYDCIICVANWPEVRSHVWKTLLQARALENQAYVVGVNRTGKDNNGVNHSGDSMILSPKGDVLAGFGPNEQGLKSALIDVNELKRFRAHFFAAADWDDFEIKNT